MILRHSIRYAVSPEKETLLDCILHGVNALEALFPASQLMITEKRDGNKLIKNREKYLHQRLKRGAKNFSLSNGKPNYHYAKDKNHIKNNHIGMGGCFYEFGEVVYNLNISFETETWAEFEYVLVSVGDAIGVCNGTITLRQLATTRQIHYILGDYYSLMDGCSLRMLEDESWREQAEASMRIGEKLRTALSSLDMTLPTFIQDPFLQRETWAQPLELGWLNYWSVETCEFLGFPDLKRDKDLLKHSYQTPTGAWLVKLTPDPLDLNRLEDLKVFAEIYQRFPKIGIRPPAHNGVPASYIKLPKLSNNNMNYPENTAYINEGELDYIISHLIPFMQACGFKVIEQAPTDNTFYVTIGLFPGEEDWTVIKTIPETFFAENLPGSDEPHLVGLCEQLLRGGFILNVYSTVEAILLEVNEKGQMQISGFFNPDEDTHELMEYQRIAQENPALVEFKLLPIEVDMLELDDYGQLAEYLQDILAGENTGLCANEKFQKKLINKELKDWDGEVLYFVHK
jgi:hypothetical protein